MMHNPYLKQLTEAELPKQQHSSAISFPQSDDQETCERRRRTTLRINFYDQGSVIAEQLKNLLLKLSEQAANKKISIEACHLYVDANIEENELLISAEIARQISGFIDTKTPAKVEKILFIDDLVSKRIDLFLNDQPPEKPTSFITTATSALSKSGFNIDRFILESEQMSKAREILEELTKKNQVKRNKKGKLMLKHGWIPLTGKSGNLSCPSCSLLDAALYLDKLASSGGTITILPATYQEQQAQVKAILSELGFAKLNVLIVYFSPKKLNIDSYEYWGKLSTN